MKLALALVATPLLASATSMDAPIRYDAINMVVCGQARGTAFHIGEGRLVTAEHVSENGPCSISGVPLQTVREDDRLDIAELRGPGIGPALDLSCKGVRRGRVYRAVGWGQGMIRLTLPLYATRNRDADSQGLHVMLGTVERGMSGGPVIDAKGKVAAITNRHSPARVRALSDTFLCREARR